MITLAGHTAAVRSVAYSPDGTQLVSGSEDGSVRLWDLAGGGEVRTWTKLRRSVETVNFLADGSAILAGTDQGTFLALDPAGKAKASKWQVEAHPAGVRSIVSMADSSHAVSTGWDRRLLFWDLKKQKSTALREPLPSSPSAMALSPRGDTLAIAQMYSSQILLVELDVRGPHGQLDFKAGSAYSLAFSSDGTLLAAGDTAGNVLVWELKTGKKPWVMKGHRWVVYGVAFSPNARLLVTGGADGTARVWDVGTRRELHVFQWHKTWITCLAISPDGLTVATGSQDHTIAVWDMPD